jgi:hypothetical protein
MVDGQPVAIVFKAFRRCLKELGSGNHKVTKEDAGVGQGRAGRLPRSVDQGWAAEGGVGRGVAAGGAATTIPERRRGATDERQPLDHAQRESVENRVEFKNP